MTKTFFHSGSVSLQLISRNSDTIFALHLKKSRNISTDFFPLKVPKIEECFVSCLYGIVPCPPFPCWIKAAYILTSIFWIDKRFCFVLFFLLPKHLHSALVICVTEVFRFLGTLFSVQQELPGIPWGGEASQDKHLCAGISQNGHSRRIPGVPPAISTHTRASSRGSLPAQLWRDRQTFIPRSHPHTSWTWDSFWFPSLSQQRAGCRNAPSWNWAPRGSSSSAGRGSGSCSQLCNWISLARMDKCIPEVGHFTGCHRSVAHSLLSQHQLPGRAGICTPGPPERVLGEESEQEQSQRPDSIFQR